MSSDAITVNAVLAAAGDWRELASRDTDGLAVSLLWNAATDAVKVTVADSRLDEEFELPIAGADALDAFHHPFAYAVDRGLSFGDALRELIDLQLQS
jgi:hypothetical protein